MGGLAVDYRRAIHVSAFVLLFVLLCAPLTLAQQASSARPTAALQQTPLAGPAIPVYPDTPAGLDRLVKDMLKLQKKGDAAALAPYIQSLVLPDADAWFKAVFGGKWGPKLASHYESANANFAETIATTLGSLAKEDDAKLAVVSFDGSCQSQATQQEFPILLFHRKKTSLYSVRYEVGTNLASLSMFAYVGGTFRYVGNARGQMGQPAKANGPQRKVILSGTIGTDGVLRHLRVEKGPCWLEELAEKSAESYSYRSAGVVVDTTVTIIFTTD